jgi:hypothetical protein
MLLVRTSVTPGRIHSCRYLSNSACIVAKERPLRWSVPSCHMPSDDSNCASGPVSTASAAIGTRTSNATNASGRSSQVEYHGVVMAANGEVEGPHRSACWRRGRTISPRPRRQPRSASQTPPTIVRPHNRRASRIERLRPRCPRVPARTAPKMVHEELWRSPSRVRRRKREQTEKQRCEPLSPRP